MALPEQESLLDFIRSSPVEVLDGVNFIDPLGLLGVMAELRKVEGHGLFPDDIERHRALGRAINRSMVPVAIRNQQARIASRAHYETRREIARGGSGDYRQTLDDIENELSLGFTEQPEIVWQSGRNGSSYYFSNLNPEEDFRL